MPTTKTWPEPIDDEEARGHIRARHIGLWLAWSEDQKTLIASAETPEAVRRAATAAGHARFIYDWVPPAEDRQTTGLA